MYQAKKEKITHDKICAFLKNNPKGLTITELVKGAKFSRKAVEKHVQLLILENEVYMKQFGVTKVYYPNHRINHLDFERMNYDNKTIWFDILENEYGKYLLIQKKKKAENEWVHEHSITIPVEQSERFLKVLGKILRSPRMRKFR